MVRGMGCLKVMGARGAVDEEGGEGGAGVARDEDSWALGAAAGSSSLGDTSSEINGPGGPALSSNGLGPHGPAFPSADLGPNGLALCSAGLSPDGPALLTGSAGTYNSCKGSVDTPPTDVDTILQTQGKMMKKWSSGVDAGSSCVDTRFSSQKACLPVLYVRLRISRFYHGSVDTVPGSVDTRSEFLKRFHEDRVHCVDTVPGSVDTSPSLQKTKLPDWDNRVHCVDTLPGSVDTSPSLQKTQLPDWDSVLTQSQAVSTQSQVVSTLVQGSVDTSLNSQKNSFTEMGQCVDTLPGGVDTLWLKLKNVNFSGHVAAWELRDLT
ncbi:hypothetical protein Taro_003893 [Colocasia esculenta]|uniref:Uncharacterized protein n=1 Tax=Colocasia esculenta TaxID=4460 RepID=A0A843TNH2_COLES|nr:hypothetical protein [Colocasia esculenta]